MVHDENKLNKLLDTIRRLRAKAEDPGTTEAESLAFAAKAADLLAKYGLEEAQLKVEDQEELGHEEHNSVSAKMWNASPARRLLVQQVCRLYMVRTLYWKHEKRWVLVGRKHNLIMAKEMSEYLIRTVSRLGAQYKRGNPLGNHVDFKRGCYARLAERIYDMWQQQTREQPVYTPTGNPGNLPALYKNEFQLAHDYMSKRWTFGAGRAARIRQGADAWAGRRAADDISLSRQVSGGRSNHLLPSK